VEDAPSSETRAYEITSIFVALKLLFIPQILPSRQTDLQGGEKDLARRLLKNAQIQGASFDKLRMNSPEE
jgi:hypothetical protein